MIAKHKLPHEYTKPHTMRKDHIGAVWQGIKRITHRLDTFCKVYKIIGRGAVGMGFIVIRPVVVRHFDDLGQG